jgi:LysR family transcriptional regulator, low CO2-responsive transcriptional regulator
MNMLSRLDFDALFAFSTFAESMNFSEAARQLHISQPALHVKVRKLGEQLERPLYCRIGRTLELTPFGEALARHGREVRFGSEEFLSQFGGASQHPIILAAGEGAYLYLLGNGIRHFQREEKAPLHLLSLDRDETLAAVTTGKAQLGVAPLDFVPAAMQAFPFTTVGQVLAVPSGHRLASRSRLKLKDLANERLVVPPSDRPHRQMLAALLQSQQVNWQVAMEASGWELILSFVSMGVGVAVINAHCKLPKGITTIPIPELPSLRYHCFHLRGLAKSPGVMRLRTLLLEHGDAWRSRG